MNSGLNQTLMFAFISRHYPFSLSPDIIEKGYRIMSHILKALVCSYPNVQNLNRQNTANITKLILSQFAYRFGGVEECIAAFGNFYQKKLTQMSAQILTKFNENVLEDEEIYQILDPLKCQLYMVSYFLEQTGEFPQVSHEEYLHRKVQFLKMTLGLDQPRQIVSKKKRMRRKREQKVNSSRVSYSSRISYLSCFSKSLIIQIQQQRNTEVDDHQFSVNLLTSEHKNKNSIGTTALNQNLLVFLDKQQKSANNMETQESTNNHHNLFILRYEDFFPQKLTLNSAEKGISAIKTKIIKLPRCPTDTFI